MTHLKLTLAVALLFASGVSKAEDRYDSAEEENVAPAKGYNFVVQDRSKLDDEKNPQIVVTTYNLKSIPESLKEKFDLVVVKNKAGKQETEEANKLFIKTIPALAKTDKSIQITKIETVAKDDIDSDRMESTPACWRGRCGGYYGGYYGRGFGYAAVYPSYAYSYAPVYQNFGYAGCNAWGNGCGYAGYGYSYGMYGGFGYTGVSVGYYGYGGFGCGWM
jgi:hypothetical protein